jgi:hypothetical protein
MPKTLLAAGALIAVSGSLVHAQPSATTLNFYAEAISADGRVVVGENGAQPCYWTRQAGRVNIPVPSGSFAQTKALAVSGDGSVVCGTTMPTGTVPYAGWYWTQESGMVLISVPGAGNTQVECISRDGSTIGGAAVVLGAQQYQGFVWTAQDGGRFVPRGVNYATWITGLSPSGLAAIGHGSSGGGTWPMFWGSTYVWCESLGVIPGELAAYGLAMTPDGRTVVGSTTVPLPIGGAKAYVWTAETGGTDIDPPPDYLSASLVAISDDGRIAAGYVLSSEVGLIWRKSAGLMLAADYFRPYGITQYTGGIVGMSADGRELLTPMYLIELGACGLADFNHDGDSGTDADIEAFFGCLAGDCCAMCDSADFDGDGDSGTDQDIEAFFRVLAGGSC